MFWSSTMKTFCTAQQIAELRPCQMVRKTVWSKIGGVVGEMFNLVRANKMLGFGFVQTQKGIVNLLGFACPLVLTGEFDLFVTDTLCVGARASFSQTVEEDLPGYKYKLADPEEGFFNIEALDTVKQEVQGRFKAKFKRGSKNGWSEDLGLPENLTFEGVFYEKYVVR